MRPGDLPPELTTELSSKKLAANEKIFQTDYSPEWNQHSTSYFRKKQKTAQCLDNSIKLLSHHLYWPSLTLKTITNTEDHS